MSCKFPKSVGAIKCGMVVVEGKRVQGASVDMTDTRTAKEVKGGTAFVLGFASFFFFLSP